MRFKFTIQPYQTEAVDSVVGVFAGQPFNDRFSYRSKVKLWFDLFSEDLSMGFANFPVQITSEQMLQNVTRIQSRNNIELAQTLVTDGLGACSLDVEMETGTGKTYVYIKTVLLDLIFLSLSALPR